MTHLLSLSSIHFILASYPRSLRETSFLSVKWAFFFKEFKGASRTASDIDAIERVLAEDA